MCSYIAWPQVSEANRKKDIGFESERSDVKQSSLVFLLFFQRSSPQFRSSPHWEDGPVCIERQNNENLESDDGKACLHDEYKIRFVSRVTLEKSQFPCFETCPFVLGLCDLPFKQLLISLNGPPMERNISSLPTTKWTFVLWR